MAGHSQGEARVAESPSSQVAHFSRVAQSRVAAPGSKLSVTWPTLAGVSHWVGAGTPCSRPVGQGGGGKSEVSTANVVIAALLVVANENHWAH